MKGRGVIALVCALGAGARGEAPPRDPAPGPAAPAAPIAPTIEAPTAVPTAIATGRLSGRVRERGSAAPVVGATVSALDVTATTDGEGGFLLELPAGPATVTIAATGYEPLRIVEPIAAGAALRVEYRLLPASGPPRRFSSTVRGNAAHEGERVTLRDEELRQLPGSLGDPLRVVGALPGVIQPVPLLPAYSVRGGSPGMNGFFLDGMRVPQLFHLVLVEGVVHPAAFDRIDFYPGAYDATFGHYASGVIDAATRPGRTDAPAHGELELKLYDASAFAEVRLPGGASLLVAGRYGVPGLVIGLVEPRVNVVFGDYLLRLDWKGLTIEALGSYDRVDIDTADLSTSLYATHVGTTFHRLQIRERVRRGAFELDAAVVGGFDQATAVGGQSVDKLGLSARLDARLRLAPFTLQLGLDGEVSSFRGANFTATTALPTAAPVPPSLLGPDDLGELGGSHGGSVGGAYAQAVIPLDRLLGRPAAITVGLRADAYHAGTVTLVGIAPRLLLRYQPLRRLEFSAGFGLYQQPPAFPVPLPGIDTFALRLGLQQSWQGSVGIKVNLPLDLSLSATGYYARFTNINDIVLDGIGVLCAAPTSELLTGLTASILHALDGDGYGLEVLLRRRAGVVTGWLAYTLSRSERVFSCGLAPSDFDQTHVLNLVVQARLPWRLMAGARLTYNSGRPYTRVTIESATQLPAPVRGNARLPDFVELDLRLDREWVFNRWAIAAFLEVANSTLSRSILGVTYPQDPTLKLPRYDQPQFQGFRWILPSLGVRARF